LPRVWLWFQQAGPALLTDQGPQTMDEFVDDWLVRGARCITWGVYRDGELGGWIVYEPVTPTTGNAHCVFRKGTGRGNSFWGWKTTIPAISAALDDLFGIGVLRVGLLIQEENRTIESLILHLGAVKEALWYSVRGDDGQPLTKRGAVLRFLQYGLYREQWYERQKATAANSVEPVPADLDVHSSGLSQSAS